MRQHGSPNDAVIPREGGESSTPRPLCSITTVSEYWITRSSRAMTASVQLQTHLRGLAAQFARALLDLSSFLPPSCPRGRREGRVLTSHPRSAARKAHAGKPHSSIQVVPITRPSLRDGLTAYAVLSREPNSFWPPSPRELTMRLTRLGAPHLRESLAVATTVRTTRFCRTRVRLMPQGSMASCT